MATHVEKIAALDLTQSTGVLVAEDANSVSSPVASDFPPFPPVVLLPLHDREPALAGPSAGTHRRGAGFSWPVESQIASSADSERGCGRVPLVLAWARLVLASERADPNFPPELCDYDQTPFVWRPQSGQVREMRPEAVVTESIKAWVAEGSKDTAVVVPDSLGEKAQQALLDGSDCRLVPRTMALAVAWCRQNEERFQAVQTDSGNGTSVGYVWVVSLAMDIWEMDLVEVRAVKPAGQNRVWLVPVRHRRQRSDLPFVGLRLASDILLKEEQSTADCWRTLFASTDLEQWFAKARPAGVDDIGQALRVHGQRLIRKLGGLRAISKGLCELTPSDNADLFTAVRERVDQLQRAVPEARVIGAISGGSFAPVVRLDTSILWQPLIRTIPREPRFIHVGQRHTPAIGAWHVAYAMNSDPPLPSYRDTLVPVEMYAIHPQRGSVWIPVVPGIAVDAGAPYRSPEPILGFSIAAGANHLDFTVRRPIRDNYIYRGLPAELAQPTPQQESVRVTAEALPGQGYARVSVISTRDGLFSTRLNWHKMIVVPEPVEIRPRLAYIPNASHVDASPHVWARAVDPNAPAPWLAHNHSGGLWPQCVGLMHHFVNAQGQPAPGLIWQLIGLHFRNNIGNMNRWPFAHLEAEERGEQIEPDLFRHIGVFGSDGNLGNLPPLAGQFRARLGALYADENNPVLCRLGGWMYAAVPDDIREATRACFADFNEGAIDDIPQDLMKIVFLHVAGLAWNRMEEYSLFLRAMVRAIESGRIMDQSPMDDQPANALMQLEWLRAFRNLVRFRDDALCRAAATDADMHGITRYIAAVFADNVEQKLVQRKRGVTITKRLNECLRALPFMLKRRRDDPAYLGSGYAPEDIRRSLENALQIVAESDPLLFNHTNPDAVWQIPFAVSTFRFLKEEAQQEDVRNILQYAD